MDSTRILAIDHIPESLTIVGGGVIGIEFAGIFNALGSKVTVIEFMKQILPPFDSDIAKRLKQSLSKQGIQILTGAAVKRIEQTAEGEALVTYELKGKEETVTSTDILMAVGRKPHTEGLNLQAAGFKPAERPSAPIHVDENMLTEVPHIYAIGDVNAKTMLAHVATFQGIRALNHIQGKTDTIDFGIIPSAVFITPECGMAGLTEQQCKDKGLEIACGTSFYRANGKALSMGESEGLCKLIFCKATGRLIGAHIMGAQAADLAQQAADLMARKATREDICNTIFSHPTISELLLAAAHNVK
jgi:dihydrolipoamide dehydrogenase